MKSGKLGVANRTADAFRKLQVPTTVTELKSFLGLRNVFRRFVPSFERIVSSLSKRLSMTQVKVLGRVSKHKIEALEKLKEQLTSWPVLTLPKSNGQYMLGTDACEANRLRTAGKEKRWHNTTHGLLA